MSGTLVVPNLCGGEELDGINLKKVLNQSKFIYLIPSQDIYVPGTSAEAYVSRFADSS